MTMTVWLYPACRSTRDVGSVSVPGRSENAITKIQKYRQNTRKRRMNLKQTAVSLKRSGLRSSLLSRRKLKERAQSICNGLNAIPRMKPPEFNQPGMARMPSSSNHQSRVILEQLEYKHPGTTRTQSPWNHQNTITLGLPEHNHTGTTRLTFEPPEHNHHKSTGSVESIRTRTRVQAQLYCCLQQQYRALCVVSLHLDLGPPLKVSRGHIGNIQYTHMGGGLDVPGPLSHLGPCPPPH